MPLRPGKSNRIVHENVREMIESGHPVNQAVAASYRKAGRSRKKRDRGRR